ncbi:O-antigen polymerase [Curtobacterium sp. AB451]|uniref:O-antigen polymerase n=1 Tax=Curtobacterium sp. AB451 TaxID=3422306 RepID=UPI003D344A98
MDPVQASKRSRRTAPGTIVVLRRVVFVVGAVAALAATMNWISAVLVAPLFSYLGYTYVGASPMVMLAAVLLTSAVALALPVRITRPSHVVLWALFVVCVAPTMLMGVSAGYLSAGTALLLSAAVGTAFVLVAAGIPRSATVGRSTPSDVLRLGSLAIRRSTLTWTVCAVYSLLTYGIMAATVGIHVRFLALDDIYDVRADYTADVGSGGTLGYLLTGQAYVVNPLLLARGIFRRRPSLIVLALVGQFLLYSSTGFKAVLFSFVAVLGMALLFRGRSTKGSAPFLVAPLAIMVVSALADEAQGGITWTSVFTRRFMLAPGLLSSVYVDYFSQNPVAMYAYSFLDTWFDYPYDLAPPKRIADYLVPGSTGYANANLFADGFANFGWLGIGIAAFALWVWLRVVDRAAHGLPMRVAAMALVMPSIMLSNTSVFTAMLSHGLLFGTIILAICPRTGWEPEAPGSTTRTERSGAPASAASRARRVAVGADRVLRAAHRFDAARAGAGSVRAAYRLAGRTARHSRARSTGRHSAHPVGSGLRVAR